MMQQPIKPFVPTTAVEHLRPSNSPPRPHTDWTKPAAYQVKQ